MKWSWGQLGPVFALVLAGCGDGDGGPTTQAPPPGSAKPQDLSRLSVVEVTTVTTVQGSGGIFLSPRPQQERPQYVERGAAAGSASPAPSIAEDRAKVDVALLFRAVEPRAFQLEATLGELEAQHYFPALRGRRWPITLPGRSAGWDREAWNEWDGWRAYSGLAVEDAPAATLDYERLGQQSPLVLSMVADSGGEHLLVTNRSARAIAEALLVYSHAGGVGIRVVQNLTPGMSQATNLGPKEHPPEVLLGEARDALDQFFSTELGPELGLAIARSKSIPFLETYGMRLIYLLDDALAPTPIELPNQLGAPRRVAIAHAEVLQPAEEEHVLQVLARGVTPAEVPAELGRFAHAKLEAARINGDEQVQGQAQQLLQSLSE